VFETDIAAHPADWHMLQRLWLADLPPQVSRDRG
jgi:KDO2-lipid IV(A) lauroyltransferase